jgi:hypothetical protein
VAVMTMWSLKKKMLIGFEKKGKERRSQRWSRSCFVDLMSMCNCLQSWEEHNTVANPNLLRHVCIVTLFFLEERIEYGM